MRPDLAKCTTECYRRGAGSIEHVYKLKFGGKVPSISRSHSELLSILGNCKYGRRHGLNLSSTQKYGLLSPLIKPTLRHVQVSIWTALAGFTISFLIYFKASGLNSRK